MLFAPSEYNLQLHALFELAKCTYIDYVQVEITDLSFPFLKELNFLNFNSN